MNKHSSGQSFSICHLAHDTYSRTLVVVDSAERISYTSTEMQSVFRSRTAEFAVRGFNRTNTNEMERKKAVVMIRLCPYCL